MTRRARRATSLPRGDRSILYRSKPALVAGHPDLDILYHIRAAQTAKDLEKITQLIDTLGAGPSPKTKRRWAQAIATRLRQIIATTQLAPTETDPETPPWQQKGGA